MNKLELNFPHEGHGFDPGSEISVIATWDLKAPPRKIELRLVWSTSGKGDTDLKVVKTITLDAPGPQGEQLLVVPLPWGPYSFSGKLISLIWGLELVALPSNDSCRREITVAPRGNEVLLLGQTF